MLTIHEPITLTANPSIVSVSDNFAQRIMGNYQMMASKMNLEEMIHFISVAPEIYLADGDMNSFINMKNSYTNQSENIQLINNVLNRILVSDTYQMMYQDKVFIENVLRKIGIEDVREFITQVTQMRQDVKSINKLIQAYQTDNSKLVQLEQYYENRTKKSTDNTDSNEIENKEPLWIHQEILQRLMTENIYEKLDKYVSNNYQDINNILSRQMQISEQSLMAKNMQFNAITNNIKHDNSPLIYNRVNMYELGDITNIEEDSVSMIQNIVKAVLLNALNQIYSIKIKDLSDRKNVWYKLGNAIHQVTENTVKRYETYHSNDYVISQKYTDDIENIDYAQNINISEADITTNNINQEILKQQLDLINQQNIEKYEKLQQLQLTTNKSNEGKKINKALALKDAIKAISDSTDVINEYNEKFSNSENVKLINRKKYEEIFDNDTIEILEVIENYYKSPELRHKRVINNEQAQAQFIQDIQRYTQKSVSELTNETNDVRRELIHNIKMTDIVTTNETNQVNTIHKNNETKYSRVEMYHKQNETVIDEELVQEINSVNKSMIVNTKEITENVNLTHEIHEIVKNQVNEIRLQQNEELSQIISRNINDQIGNLSEQVYGKIERRMDTERKRRGL